MAAFHLEGQDITVQISLGGTSLGGAAPSYTTALVLIGSSRNLRVSESLDTVQVAGMGTTRKKIRSKRGETTITMEKFVLSTGADYFGKLGFYAKFEVKELSTLASYKAYEGIITEWEWSSGDDEQAEKITIECDAEHA